MRRAQEQAIRRYRHWYAKMLRLYSKPFYQRFGESMERTFGDLLRERAEEKNGLFAYTLWLFAETCGAILRENLMTILKQNKDIIGVALAAASLLLAPLVAMQFSDEVAWGPGDFVIAGVLLIGAAVAFRLATRRKGKMAYRAAVGMAIGAALFLVWANLAVGLLGNEENPANLMYLGVLAVGLIGVGFARFQPRGMAHTLFAMALAQGLIAVIALLAGMHRQPGSSVAEIVNVNGFFIALFVVSALLFRHAASGHDRQPMPN